METLLFLGLAFIVSLVLFFLESKKPRLSSKLPRGNTGWPILGETLEYARCPAEFVRNRMVKHSPDIFQTSFAGEKIAVFCGPSGNKFIYSNEHKLRPWIPRTFLKALSLKTVDRDSPPVKFFNEQFKSFLKVESLQHYVPVMDSKARDHLEMHWVPYDEVKVQPLSKEFTFSLICYLTFNFHDMNQVKDLAEAYKTLVKGLVSVPVNLPGTRYNKALKASKVVRDKLMDLITKRKMELVTKEGHVDVYHGGREGLLSRLLEASERGGGLIKDDELAGLILGVIFAGYNTTSNAITFVINCLAEYPHVYAKVLQEQLDISKTKGKGELLTWKDIQKMKYTWNVVCESMRLIPPAPGGFREAATELSYAGYTIPKGWMVHWNFYSTHKDPKYFPNPENFEPSRFEATMPPGVYVPFGKGPHMCYGNEYARIKILILLHNVVTRFRLSKANPHEKLIYTPDLVSVEGLRICLQPHENLQTSQ